MDNKENLEKMFSLNKANVFCAELEKCFENIPKLNMPGVLLNVHTEYLKTNLNDLKDALSEMAKNTNQVIVVGKHITGEINAYLKALALSKNIAIVNIYNDSNEQIGYRASFDETAAAANVINIECGSEKVNIIKVIEDYKESLLAEKEKLENKIISFELKNIEPIYKAYLPDFRLENKYLINKILNEVNVGCIPYDINIWCENFEKKYHREAFKRTKQGLMKCWCVIKYDNIEELILINKK